LALLFFPNSSFFIRPAVIEAPVPRNLPFYCPVGGSHSLKTKACNHLICRLLSVINIELGSRKAAIRFKNGANIRLGHRPWN
jgi:hypothetical protein